MPADGETGYFFAETDISCDLKQDAPSSDFALGLTNVPAGWDVRVLCVSAPDLGATERIDDPGAEFQWSGFPNAACEVWITVGMLAVDKIVADGRCGHDRLHDRGLRQRRRAGDDDGRPIGRDVRRRDRVRRHGMRGRGAPQPGAEFAHAEGDVRDAYCTVTNATTTTTTTTTLAPTTTTTLAPTTTATLAPTTTMPATSTAAFGAGAGTLPQTGASSSATGVLVLMALALLGSGAALLATRRRTS